MRHKLLQTELRSWGGMIAVLFCVAHIPEAHAGDYRFGYPGSYYYPNSYYGLHDDFGLQQDVRRIDDQMKRQQRQLDEQVREQQEQSRLLRQQQSAQHRLTAMQACHYRFNGGLDLCDRLFDAATKKHAACVDTAKEMNPGCALDIARPASNPAD